MRVMLIRFNVRNFLSFFQTDEGKSVEFSMISGKGSRKRDRIFDDGTLKLLKTAAIYGANASGKSNFVKAMSFMKHTMLYGLPKGHTELYCKIKKENQNQASYFEMEICLDDKYYAYGFEVILSQGKFVSEWLVELCKDKEKIIFSRDIPSGKYDFGKDLTDGPDIKKLTVYMEDIKSDYSILFLQIMNRNKDGFYASVKESKSKKSLVFQKLYHWVNKRLDINYPDEPISNYSYLAKSEDIDTVCKMISYFDTGIRDVKVENIPLEKALEVMPDPMKEDVKENIERISSILQSGEIIEGGLFIRAGRDFYIFKVEHQEIICQTIRFEHESKGVFFNLPEESDGTIRLLQLLEILLVNENKTYVIDELDRCLHPMLTYRFMEIFLDLAKKRNVQLIFTTHESRLLNFELFRRDEVWFVNKDENGASEVYSLDEYNERFDKKLDKAYLEGRYGGVPVFDLMFPLKGDE
ncbi:hypothetical protein HMPREF0389_01227 [Filifactor alocis ATCC 35896]|uniref:ATPase AAA-type core domain-containing protein n=2 Tax=Filifactor TaxID=44259 RepID=D6GSZ0_FILAD|nr:hypothetical protein HMPREF0389_01227 [Filifactor alocis ATCC 35896]